MKMMIAWEVVGGGKGAWKKRRFGFLSSGQDRNRGLNLAGQTSFVPVPDKQRSHQLAMSTPMEVDAPVQKTSSSGKEKPRFEVKKVCRVV
jgi:hypothetical protein